MSTPNEALAEMRRWNAENTTPQNLVCYADDLIDHMECWYAEHPQCAAGEFARLHHLLASGEALRQQYVEQFAWQTMKLARLREALALMYDKWENGDYCYEDPEDCSGYLGKAFKLSYEEENEILGLLERVPHAAIRQEGEAKP